MIRGRPSTLIGGQNKVFADCLMDRDSVDRTLLRVKTRARFKVKMRIPLRAVSLVFGLLCNRAKVAASGRNPACSLAHSRGHSKECLTAQRHSTAQRHFVSCYPLPCGRNSWLRSVLRSAVGSQQGIFPVPPTTNLSPS